jgi:HK97 family phage portal protein
VSRFGDWLRGNETPSASTIEYDPEVGLTQTQWESLPEEMRAIMPWNVVGDLDSVSRTTSGANINEENSFKMGVVFAAVTLIADGVASLPPMAYRMTPEGSRESVEIPQWIRRPHPEIRRFDMFNQLLVSTLTWGNGYAMFQRRPSDGVVVGLTVLDPASVSCEWDPDKPGYRRYRINNTGPWLNSFDIFHVQGPTLPGDAKGMSVISYAREAIGLGLTLEEYGARYFGQGSQAKVVLEIPSQIDEPKAKAIVRTFERFHRGRENWHRPAIVSGGAKLHQISISPDDAQFLQSRDFQAVEIARWFRVPPHRVGIVSKSTSWGSGLAEENMAMLQHTYRPWITRLQDALTMYSPGGQDALTIVELDTSALLQGTFKEQADIWTGLYEKKVVTRNEARMKLGLPKVADGDQFLEDTPSPNDANSPGEGGRTKEDDRLRKQQEAARSMDVFSFEDIPDELLETELELRKMSASGGNPNHDNKGRFASKKGMSPATPERKQEFKEKVGRTIPPAWTDVHIADDLDNSSLLVVGRDAKGRQQSWYSAAHTKAQAAKKFQRIKEMNDHIPKLDSALDRDSLVNDDAGALTLIRRLGMRPGSNSNTGAKVQAHGATNIKAKHVKFNEDGSATLDFTGKDGVHIVLNTHDKKVVDVLQSRHIGKNDEDQLFNTNEEKVRNYFRGPGGMPQGFLLKDLRTHKANTVALKEIDNIEPPKNKQEFLRKRKEVATIVSGHLGNDPSMALNSYINPAVFSKWVKDESWLT